MKTLWILFVAGHQKKMMLAVDRLKKLQLAAKRSAQQNAELFESSALPPEQCSSMCDSYPSPSVTYHSPSKLFIGPQKSPSYCCAATSDIYRRPGESSYTGARSRSLMAYQPEMVAIHVRRSTNVQSPAVYDVPVISPAGYESFHGTPVQDASVASPYNDTAVVRMRRASGDSYASAPCSASPYSMMTPPLCVTGGGARLPASRASAPSTPLHVTSRLTPSNVTPKKIPPVPPQRTNSVKVSGSPAVTDTESLLTNSQHGSPQYRSPMCGSLDRISKNNRHCAETTHSDVSTVPCSTATSTPETVTLTAAETGSTGDCSTLPFANENIGTIRQRGSASATHDDDADDKPIYDEYSGTVRRRGGH